ncbi:MAG: nucleoside-diphosphate sugar epimerase/dehydratase [Elusimicrobiales bacterium]|jgi:FlaA1/EpsC-like NDP-sugar epimerase
MKLLAFAKKRIRYLSCLLDAGIVIFSYGAAFLLRFGPHAPGLQVDLFFKTFLMIIAVNLLSFGYFGLYRSIWRYTGMNDLFAVIKAVVTGNLLASAFVLFFWREGFSRSILIIAPLLTLLLVGGKKFLVREFLNRRVKQPAPGRSKVFIFGAGDLGESVLRELHRAWPHKYKVAGFLDDSSDKWGRAIHGIPILGGREEMVRLIEKHGVDEIVIAISHSRGRILGDLMEICDAGKLRKKVQFKTVPTVYEALTGSGQSRHSLRKIELSDLLHRRPVQTDMMKVAGLIQGRTVLVTGAGGTIGSELSRQIMKFKPKTLLLLENHNTALFYIEKELAAATDSTKVVPIAGDVKDRSLLENVFSAYKPDLVFHAAAHKHVPLMESNPQEAVKNNTLATRGLVETAMAHGTDRMLFISTDKAVRPSSVMGVSKRLSEMVISSLSGKSKTKLMSVRFGNVLGSSGSVVNIFREQIANGGPVTITHPDATRYFMTTQEAVQLVLQACALSAGGEVFVLNMGEPVKVMDLAKNVIRLAGFEPGRDIEIRSIGLRPGEKLHEELFRPTDIRGETGHPDIFMAVPEGRLVSDADIVELRALCQLPDPAPLLAKAKEMVRSFNRLFNNGAELEADEAETESSDGGK